MKVTDEDLRHLFSASPAGPRPGRSTCPAPEALAEAASGSFGATSRDALADHLVACADCAEEYRLRGSVEPSSEGAPRPSPRLGALRWHWGWMAAAAVLVAALATPLLRPPAPAPTVRMQSTHEIRSLVPEDAPLPREAFLLRWTPGPAGTRYAVTVASTDLTTLHAATSLTDAALQVPPGKLTAIPSGGRILWTVEATLPDGRRVRSPAFAARLE